jgi:hypothetical protein
MTDHWKKMRGKTLRIKITDEMRMHLSKDNEQLTITDLAKRSGLPYELVYNIVHKRVNSISVRHFRRLFQTSVPQQHTGKVDGTYFRKMADLWLYLNRGENKSSLYFGFYGSRSPKKADYRIFSGKIRSIDVGLELMMERKFLENGVDRTMLEQWIDERDRLKKADRIPYGKVRPMLLFLRDKMAINPTFLLNQFFDRYERGELKTVSRKIYERSRDYKARAEKALSTDDQYEIERVKEELYGTKKGYTLYGQVEQELQFLKQYARKSPKYYLGRSTYMYRKGGCKRIPTWRAANILNDCKALIRTRTDLPLKHLPARFKQQRISCLIALLLSRAADLLSKDDGIALEKSILSPSLPTDEYKNDDHGFIRFDRVPKTLGMKKPAFDLMVAKNCEIFRKVGTYAHRWYLSDLYLKELARNPYFNLITTKYEKMAGRIARVKPTNECMY